MSRLISMNPRGLTASFAAASLLLASCGGGGSPTPSPTPTPTASPGGLYAKPAQEALSVAEVQQILAQAVGEAQAQGLNASIVVVDRVGNVLAAFEMNGVAPLSRTSDLNGLGDPVTTKFDLVDTDIPTTGAAIAKAITGAYLSSSGNAFSTRTASMIVQQHFPPAEFTPGLESGPLFGVQFSSLPCSDLVARFNGNASANSFIGPKRTPLGLAADPGGLPLYKNGVVVGGIGVMGDGDYAFDRNVIDRDFDREEAIALAGTQGFTPPTSILADRIPVDGSTLRFSDMTLGNLSPLQTNFAAINNVAGRLVDVPGYSTGVIIPGTPYGTEASGYRPARPAEFNNTDAYILTDGFGNARFPIRGGADAAVVGQPLTAAETRIILEEAFQVLTRARAQIRRPLDSRMEATISVVDTYGTVLGVVRSPDAPIFGTDVSLQKARTAAFFSNPAAAAQLLGNPDPDVADFVGRARTFFDDPNALTGGVAFSARAFGLVARPYYPDGSAGMPNGPFSRPIENWSPFSVGLQSTLIRDQVVQHALFVARVNSADTEARCTATPDVVPGQNRLQNGIQIFPGSVPIYRGNQLVGAIGLSGDGIDQDDMISFLGANNGTARAGNGLSNAPKDIRADRVVITLGNGTTARLRYVNCPFAPFLDTAQQNVCEGL